MSQPEIKPRIKSPKTDSPFRFQENWVRAAEYGAIALSFGGSLATIAFQQVALATIPLSATALLSVCHRRQISQQISCEVNNIKSTIEWQKEELIQNQSQAISNVLHKQDTEAMRVALELEQHDSRIDDLRSSTKYLRTVQNCTQQILNGSSLTNAYYTRGVGHHHLGDLREAVQDYSEAVTRDPRNAQAYYNRGIANLDLGDKQAAVDDLRDAAKVFFERGNIEYYTKAKELSQNMHDIGEEQRPENFGEKSEPERVAVMEGLFS